MSNTPPNIGLLIIGDEVLSGKRQDKHLQQLTDLLRPRGLALSWVRILGDEPALLTQTLKETFASNDIVFSCGGIGATPDDRTRQCAADALGLPIERHLEAVSILEEQFGDDAYPHRVLMAEFPKGANIIPNAYNKVSGFSYQQHYFMPGFPVMAKLMMEWVLDHYYADLVSEQKVEKAIRLIGGIESQWVEFMRAFEAQFPDLRLFSLPTMNDENERIIEMGVEGLQDEAEKGLQVIIAEAEQRNIPYEPVETRR